VHIIRRGVNRCAIFHDDADRETLLQILQEASRRYRTAFHGFVLMNTHYHGLATPVGVSELSNMMKMIGDRYSPYFNRKYGRVGTLWTNRFTAIDVDTDRYWLQCLRYIEQNPVRAHMVGDPGEYRWSSYRANALGDSIEWLAEHELYRSLGLTRQRRQLAYKAMCDVQLTDVELALLRHPPRPSREASPVIEPLQAVAAV
jgi:putative transposase